MSDCKFCQSIELVKAGFMNGKQRFYCKQCGRHQVQGDGRKKYPDSMRKMAISMYLNACGIRSIGRILNVPYQLVQQWLKQAGEILDAEVAMRKRNEPVSKIELLEMDELYAFVKENPAKSEYGLLLTETGAKLLHLK